MSRPCANPKCRISFTQEYEGQIYCSEDCENEALKRKEIKYTTLSISIAAKNEINQLKIDIEKLLGRTITYTDIIEACISILNIGGDMAWILHKEFKKK